MSLRKLLMFALVAASLTVVPAGAQGEEEGTVVEAPRQVTGNSDPVRLFNIPSLAAHPDDPSTVVMAVGDSRNGGCGLWVSRDGGLSWVNTTRSLLPEGQQFCIQRSFGYTTYPTFASDGTLYTSLSGSSPDTGHPNGPIALHVARTENLGRTHETVTIADADRITLDPADFGNEGEPVEGNLWHKFSKLATDPTDPDTLYVGWRWGLWGLDLQAPDVSLPFRPYLASSRDGGETWSEPIDLLAAADVEGGYGGSSALPVVAPDGSVYAFSEESVAPPPEGQPRPPARLLMFKSTDEGETWESSVVDEGSRPFEIVVPAVNPTNGELYLVYAARERTDDDEASTPSEVYFTASSDQGATWSEPVNITDDDPAGGADQYLPGISVAPNGRVDVAWYDFRNDPFATAGEVDDDMGATVGQRYWDVYHAYTTDGGETWSQNLRVTTPSVDGAEGVTFANYDTQGPIGIASTDGAAYLAWSDSRATGREGDAEDAYFSRVRFAEATPLAAPPTGPAPRWAWGGLGAGIALAACGLALVVGVRRTRSSPASA